MNHISGWRLSASLVLFPWFAGLLVYLFLGLQVPLVYQEFYDSPSPPFTQNRICIQDFLFPDFPIDSLEIPFGTYARQNSGTLKGSVRVEGNELLKREFIIDVQALRNNQWHRISFEPLISEPNTRGLIRIETNEIQPGNEVVLWLSGKNRFPDGELTLNGSSTSGDLAFRLLGQMKGIQLGRLIGSRLKLARPSIFGQYFWIFIVFAGFLISLLLTCKSILKSTHSGTRHD